MITPVGFTYSVSVVHTSIASVTSTVESNLAKASAKFTFTFDMSRGENKGYGEGERR